MINFNIFDLDAYYVFPKWSQLYRLSGRRGGCHPTSQLMTMTGASPRRRAIALGQRSEVVGRRRRYGIFLGLQRPRICRACHRWWQAAGHIPLRLVLQEPPIIPHHLPRSRIRRRLIAHRCFRCTCTYKSLC